MPKASPIRSSFNAGELSPLMDGRVDIAKYTNGCRRLENFIPAVQGPAVRRAGTRFVAEVKSSANRTWLVRFEFNVTQAYAIEFGHQYIRFFTNHGQLLSSGVPYEIASPYSAADLTDSDGTFNLDIVQSGDVLYIAHPSYPLQRLARYGNTNWTITPVEFADGPFLDQNINRSITVYASGATGSVTLTASSGIFSAAMVGSYVYLEPADLSTIKPWTAGQEFTTNPYGTYRRSDGKTYICRTNGTPSSGKVWRTGGDKPVHTYGTEADGGGQGVMGTTSERDGLDWEFVDAGYGYVKITGYTNSTTVTATVAGRWPLPQGVIGSGKATFRWALGAFSGVEGYPTKVTFFRERLCLAKGQRLYFSVAGDFENMATKNDSGEVVADRAIIVTISSDETNRIEWLVPTQALIIGTAGGELACQENATTEAFAPGNVKIDQQTSDGSKSVTPARVGYSTLFVQRSGRKLKEMAYNFQQNGYITNDMTVLSEHITKGGLVQLAWHKEPYVVLWCVRGDGVLLGFTFNKEQEVIGWHRHPMTNGIVESVCCIPSPDKTRDDLWMIVRRTIDGVTKRYVEYLEREYREGDDQTDCYYVDCGATYDGVPADQISGLDWLEGQTVQVLADGAAHPDRVVEAGAITLQREASKVHVGIGYPSVLQTNRIEAGAGDGTAQGKTKRLNKVVIRFLNTLGALAGPDADTLDEIEFRSASDPMDEAPPLFTGDKMVEWPDGYNFDGYVMVKQAQPLPMTVVAIMPQVHTFDR